MFAGMADLRNSPARWSGCQWRCLRPSGTAARSSIFRWRGFKRRQEAASDGLLAGWAVLSGVGAGRGFWRARVAVAAGVCSERADGFSNYGRDVLGVDFRAGVDRVETRGDGSAGGDDDVRVLVRGPRVSFPIGAGGGPAFDSVSGADAGALGADRAVLGDLPAPGERISSLLFAAAPVRVRIVTGVRGGIVRSAGGRVGNGRHHFGAVDRVFPAAAGARGKRT